MPDVQILESNIGYCNEALAFEKELSTQFLKLGLYLYTIQEENLFSPQWDSFNDYCQEFKSLSQPSISKLIGIYQTFLITYGYPKERIGAIGGWANLAETLPMIHSAEDADKWLHLAETLHRGDLRREIAEAKTGKNMKDCLHTDFYELRICRTCHDRYRVADSQSE